MKATLAKKELQETFLEFDLLGVVKRWLQVRQETGKVPGSLVCPRKMVFAASEAGPFCCCKTEQVLEAGSRAFPCARWLA